MKGGARGRVVDYMLSIADARFVRKMADKHVNIVKYTKQSF